TIDQRTGTIYRAPTTSSDDRSAYGHDISCPNDEQRRSISVRARYIVPQRRAATIDQRTDTIYRAPTTSSDDRSAYGHDISCPNDEQRRSISVRARYIVPQRRAATIDQRTGTIYRAPTTSSDDRSAYRHDISCPNDEQRRSISVPTRYIVPQRRAATIDQRTGTIYRAPTTSSDDRSAYRHDISYPNDEQRRSISVRARYIVPQR